MLSDYKIIKTIGEGSFGKVYLVSYKNHSFAMKKIYIHKFKDKQKNYLIAEIIIQKLNKCEHIIKLHDLYYENNYIYIISEFAEKGTINDYINYCKKNNLTISNHNICTWIIQIAKGLFYLHKNNIIHRDLKSENIFLDSNNNIKIGDLGIAKIMLNSRFTATNIGTPYYMSPELFNGDYYNYNADTWSLGCISYELLTLKKPFMGKNIIELANNVKYTKFNTNFINNYKNEYIIILNKLLHKDYKRRANLYNIIHDPFLNSFYKYNIININYDIMNLSIFSKLQSLPNWNCILNNLNIRKLSFIYKNNENQNKKYNLNYSKIDIKITNKLSTIQNTTIKYLNTSTKTLTPPVRDAPLLPVIKNNFKNNYSNKIDNIHYHNNHDISTKYPPILRPNRKYDNTPVKINNQDIPTKYPPILRPNRQYDNTHVKVNNPDIPTKYPPILRPNRKYDNTPVKINNPDIPTKYPPILRPNRKYDNTPLHFNKIDTPIKYKDILKNDKIHRHLELKKNYIIKNILEVHNCKNNQYINHIKYIKKFKKIYISPYSKYNNIIN